jgi:hypothetical protein
MFRLMSKASGTTEAERSASLLALDRSLEAEEIKFEDLANAVDQLPSQLPNPRIIHVEVPVEVVVYRDKVIEVEKPVPVADPRKHHSAGS